MRRGSVLPLLAPVCYLAISVFVVLWVCWNGVYPSGSDTMYHVYRGDFVYRSILEGNWWPSYNPMWYNGAIGRRCPPTSWPFARRWRAAIRWTAIWFLWA